jgi:hypothetical protein
LTLFNMKNLGECALISLQNDKGAFRQTRPEREFGSLSCFANKHDFQVIDSGAQG